MNLKCPTCTILLPVDCDTNNVTCPLCGTLSTVVELCGVIQLSDQHSETLLDYEEPTDN